MQGLCFTPDYILITAYSEDRKNLGSLMVFDRESGEYLATLGMKKESHLGGIAFDGENVWICHSNSNTLERISYEYITKIAQDAPEYCIDASALSIFFVHFAKRTIFAGLSSSIFVTFLE